MVKEEEGRRTYEEDGEFKATIWRMPPSKAPSVPKIAINEQEVFNEYVPSSTGATGAELKSNISGLLSRDGSYGSSIESFKEGGVVKQKLIHDQRTDKDSKPGIHHHLKLWRRKLVILIWLNFLMRYRKTFQTYVEIVFPVIAFGIICGSMIINNIYTVHYDPSVHEDRLNPNQPFHPFNTMEKDRILKYACANEEFCAINPNVHGADLSREDTRDVFFYTVYSPNNSFTNHLMEKAKGILEWEDNEQSRLFGVADEKEVEKELKRKWGERTWQVSYPCGVIFSFSHIPDDQMQAISKNEDLPKKLKYTIRSFFSEIGNTAENFPFVDHSAGPRSRHEVSSYIITGFSGIQLAIDLAFIEMVKDKVLLYNDTLEVLGGKKVEHLYNAYANSFQLKMFQYPFYLDHESKIRCWISVVIAIILSYVCTNFAETQEIIGEAKLGKMELLKLHGLTPALHWISYGINMTVLGTVTGACFAIMFYYCFEYNSVLKFQNATWIWMFIFLFGVAQTIENYFFALFFDSPTTGGMAAVFKSFATFLIPMKLFRNNYLSRVPNLLLCLIMPQWCLANGMYSYLQYEIYESGLKWFDFPVLIDTSNFFVVSLPICCIVFIYTIAIYLLLTIYADRILQKPFAPAIGWLYFWKNRDPKPEHQKPSPPINLSQMPKLFELPPPDLLCTIKIRNLCKTFESEKSYEISLDNINLDIVEGEILGVIGPAGSGKTNLLHLIAGLITPTAGYVEMKNLKVHEYSDFLNQFISVCPQKSMLFPTLSVEDHVRLCCMVHGVSYRKSKVQAKTLLQLFNLLGYKRHGYTYLSSTLQKKLAMAMALASSPTILILDEPCQGMDNESSKQFWKYLLSLKTKRTIIISTSRMDDVELYCDRMLLLVNGKTVCYGTPNSVKKFYDIGSVVNVLEKPDVPMDTVLLARIIKTEVRASMKLSSIGFFRKTRRYMLPFGEPYAALIESLEDNAEDLQYQKMWLGRVELGSFIHKIATSKGLESSLAAKEDFIGANISDDAIANLKKKMMEQIPKPLEPNRTFAKNFHALFMRKWLTMRQKHKFLVTEFVVPIILLILIMSLSPEFLHYMPENLARTLHIGMHDNTLTLVKITTSDAYRHEWYKAYQQVLGDAAPTQYIDKTTITQELAMRNNLSLTNSRQQTIIAFDQNEQRTIGFYSTNSYHACPIALNTMANVFLYILSHNGKEEFNTDPYIIRVSNYPVEQYEGYTVGSASSNSMVMFAFVLSVILAFIAAAELRLPIYEKKGMKQLELMAGVSSGLYWFTNACGDFIMNGIIVVIMMGVVCLIDIQNRQFVGSDEKNILALIFFTYLCFSSLPFSYFLSCILKTTHNGYSHFLILHFLLGILPNAITFLSMRSWYEGFPLAIRYMLHLFPPYSITSALIHYLQIATERSYCMDQSYKAHCNEYENVMRGGFRDTEQTKHIDVIVDSDPLFRACCEAFCQKDGTCHNKRDFFVDVPIPALRADILAMVAQGLFYWIAVLAVEQNLPQSAFFFCKTKLVGDKEIKAAQEDTRDHEEPEDVKKEHTKVDYMIDIEDNVDTEIYLVQDVTKFYKSNKCIDHVYFSIPIEKTTGILGLSKSGMSTLLKLITGQIRTSSGSIYMDNERMIKRNKKTMTEKVGYLPQQSAYYPHLTGFQMLQLFGKLRGLPDAQLDVHVNRWLSVLDLQDDAKMTCKSYRPGVLRRLCCAIAMIGKTRIVVMDQPTNDMDLKERYTLWTAIKQANELGQTTIFTSSYADEVLQTTHKVMLLDHGAFCATGPTDDVFKTNQRGYILSLRCNTDTLKKLNTYQKGVQVDQLRDHIIRHLSPCELLFNEDNILIYQLKDLTTQLSYAYGIMEGAREKFPNLLDNFLIAEPSLEDVVLDFQKSKKHKRDSSQDAGNYEEE